MIRSPRGLSPGSGREELLGTGERSTMAGAGEVGCRRSRPGSSDPAVDSYWRAELLMIGAGYLNRKKVLPGRYGQH